MNYESIASDAIASGTITGVAAAIVIGIWGEVSIRIKNWKLERAVKASVERFVIGSGIHGIYVGINNSTGVEIKARGVTILTPEASFILNAETEIKNIWADNSKGDKYAGFQIGTIFRKGMDEKYPDIPPYSTRGFRLTLSAHGEKSLAPFGIIAVIEFPLHDGEIKIVRVVSKKSTDDLLLAVSDRMDQDVKNGQIDKARAMFKLPPVRPLKRS